jgi:hypothetical protein
MPTASNILLIACAVGSFAYPCAAAAQGIAIERMEDWEFRFEACRTAVMMAGILSDVAANRDMLNPASLTNLHAELRDQMESSILENSGYPFTPVEAALVSDLTLSITLGFDWKPGQDRYMGLVFGGFESCSNLFDALLE